LPLLLLAPALLFSQVGWTIYLPVNDLREPINLALEFNEEFVVVGLVGVQRKCDYAGFLVHISKYFAL